MLTEWVRCECGEVAERENAYDRCAHCHRRLIAADLCDPPARYTPARPATPEERAALRGQK